MTIIVELEHDPERGWAATSPNVPIFAIGDSRDEVLLRFGRSLELLTGTCREDGTPFPYTAAASEASDIVTLDMQAA